MPINFRGNTADRSRLCWNTNTDWNLGSIPATLEVNGIGDAAILRLKDKVDNDDDISYTTEANYTLSDGSKLEISGGDARLKAITGGASQSWPFTTSGNYTVSDSNKIEVTGGVSRLKKESSTGTELKAYWELNSDATDSANNNDGTANNISWVSGLLGNCADFNGTTSYITIPYNTDLAVTTQDFSISLWFYIDSLPGTNSVLIHHQNYGVRGWGLRIDADNKLELRIQGSSTIETDYQLTGSHINQWNHAVATLDRDGNMLIYLNGSQVASTDISSQSAESLRYDTGSPYIWIGDYRNGESWFFDGQIDDIGFYKSKILSTNEITDLYNSGTGRTQYLYATDAPTIYNSTGYAYTGNIDTFTETSVLPTNSGIKYQVSSDDGTTWKYWTGSVWTARTDLTLVYIPTAITTIAGTHDAGTITDIQSLDTNTYDISEASGSPPVLRADIDFTNIPVAPSQVTIHAGYNGNLSHVIDVDIYNYETTSWDTLGQIPDNLGVITQYDFPVTGTKTDYLDGSGNVNIRINHTSNGTPTHDLFIDYVYLSLDSDGYNQWWYDNESNSASTINSNIQTLGSNGTFKFLSFLNTTDGWLSPELDLIEITTTATYSTTDNLYIDTKDAVQIAPSTILSWLTTTITSTLPTNTNAKLLFSVDGRVNWLTWGGSSWDAPASATARTNATSFSDAVTNFASLPLGSGTLDVRLFLYTSDNSVRPLVSNINVTSDTGIETSGIYETNQSNSGEINNPWDIVSFLTILGSGGAIVIKTKAANSTTELDAASYGAALVNGDDAGVTGQYIQFEVTITGDGTETSSIDRLCVDYDDPARDIVSP